LNPVASTAAGEAVPVVVDPAAVEPVDAVALSDPPHALTASATAISAEPRARPR
jgi:hypothetical protein